MADRQKGTNRCSQFDVGNGMGRRELGLRGRDGVIDPFEPETLEIFRRPEFYRVSSCSYHTSREFSSNAARSPMQTLTLTGTTLESTVHNEKERGRPSSGRLALNQFPKDGKDAVKLPSSKEHLPMRLSPQPRAFHQEPYPPSPAHEIDFIKGAELPSPSTHTSQTRTQSLIESARDSRPFWLVLYFFFNLGLTLYNKGVLVRFPFPYTLTAIHALFGTFGGAVLARLQVFVRPKLHRNETVILVAFSVLYALNIVVSNVSLQMVTVPFHQVVRAATPIFTILFSALLLGQFSTRERILSLVPVMAGVGLATYGDYYFTRWGLILTLLGTILAALKTIYTNVLQSPASLTTPQSWLAKIYPFSIISESRLKLHPLALISLLSPLAFVQCMFLAYFTGELDRVRVYSAKEMSSSKMMALALNGCIAFGLNVVSFSANKKVGALGITVAANVKQVLTILCAVLMFHLNITPLNMLGIVLTLLGGAWYARVEYMEKQERRTRAI